MKYFIPLKVRIHRKDLLLHLCGRVGLGVFRDTMLKEVRLGRHRDELHPVKRIRRIVNLGIAQLNGEAVCAELNVLTHEFRVHANQFARQRLGNEMFFNLDRLANNVMRLLLGELVLQLLIQKARKLGVETLVAGNEQIALAESWHEAALLEPKDGAEGATEEDALHNRKRQEARGKTRLLVLNPLKRPLGLLLNGWNRLDGLEERLLFCPVLHIRVNEKTIGL